jgi:hypothetical protein
MLDLQGVGGVTALPDGNPLQQAEEFEDWTLIPERPARY